MSAKRKVKTPSLSEAEIDDIVEAQADEDAAWDKPIQVKRKESASVAIPASLAERAAFLAKLHRERDVEEWLRRIIRERIELEESAFVEVKRALVSRRRA